MTSFGRIALAVVMAISALVPGFASEATSSGSRFVVVDLVVDSGERRLAAYQVELGYNAENITIVGLEGGKKKGFEEPPFYDRKGLKGGRIVIAAFVGKDGDATSGRQTVARLHLRITGDGNPDFSIKPITAARVGGEKINIESAVVYAR